MENKRIATREGVMHALVKLGEENRNIVVLDADLSDSTKTSGFREKFPSRFFDCGIAECNMIGVAAGLSCVGKIPFAASFAIFVAGRAFEQIRNTVCYSNLNVKIIGSHSGLSSSQDGATHQAIEDIAILRAVPNIVLLSPCDFFETFAALNKAAEHKGPVYIRTSKFAVEQIYDSRCIEYFRIGKADILKKGKTVCLFATGTEVFFSLEAAKMLEKDGISTMVVNLSTIKPLDKETVLEVAKNVEFLFTVEEHSVIGGLGEAISSFLSEIEPRLVYKIGVNDRFGESGSVEELLRKNGLDEFGIYKRVREVVFNKACHVKFL